MSKKTEVITFRTDAETKRKLSEIAEEKEWSIAQLVDKICKEYFQSGNDSDSKFVNQTTITIHNEQNNNK